MVTKKIIIFAAVVVIGFVSFVFLRKADETSTLSPSPTPIPTPFPSPLTSPEASVKSTIVYSDSGYSPSTINIKKGDMVVFRNESLKMTWTASAFHPTHKAYPGSGIEMCGTNTLIAIFDACKGYSPNESWEFKFNETGTWKYHNHLQPNHFGTIIVE